MVDLILAILHHWLAFGLVAVMLAEAVLVRDVSRPGVVVRLARLDAAYGASAGLLVIVGLLRVFQGARGTEFYVANPFFWVKMAAFAAIALLSILPTARFLRWRRALRLDPGFTPEPAEAAGVRRLLGLQALVLVVLLAAAAALPRWPL